MDMILYFILTSDKVYHMTQDNNARESRYWQILVIVSIAYENQPGDGELAWLPATYGRMLEALSILLDNQAAKP